MHIKKNIIKLSDFADLSSDELIGGYDEIKGKEIIEVNTVFKLRTLYIRFYSHTYL